MKDQITALMEALRLVRHELENFKRRRQNCDATLDAVEAILDDPKVMVAVRSIEPLVKSPWLVLEKTEDRVRVQ